LQIVEKQGQWVFGARKDVDEAAHYQMKPTLGVLLGKFRNRRLFSNDGLQFRDQIDNGAS
jgi:hypothetical protein